MVRPVIQSARTGRNIDFKQAFVNSYDEINHIIRTGLVLEGDIEIGAVELKDATTDNRQNVGLDSAKFAAFVQSESLAQESTLQQIKDNQTNKTQSSKIVGPTGITAEVNSDGSLNSVIKTLGKDVGVQNPLSIDGDSVYIKDLDISQCTASGFTFDIGSGTEQEVIESIVSDVFVGKSNDSTDNPKTIYLQFNRPILTSSFGINSAPGKYFSNTKIVLGQGEHTWTAYDDSGDNTQHQIFLFPIKPVKFSSMEIIFHTTNEIGIGLLGIFKNIEVAARIQALKPDGTVADIQATTKGNLKYSLEEFDDALYTEPLPTAEFYLNVSKGLVPGHTFINKFGQNDDLNASTYEDVWENGGVYNYPADNTAPITKLIAHNSGDTEPIEVQGLDIDGNIVVQTKTLTGLTAVTLDTPLWRVFRLRNVGTSDLLDFVCAINDGDTIDYACINNGNNQTLMALYTIPAGKTGYLIQGTNNLSNVSRGVGASGKLWMRQFGSVFQLKKTFGVHSDGSGFIRIPIPIPARMLEKTDIKVSAIGSAAGVSINTTFDILLVDN